MLADFGGAEYARDKGIPVIVFPQRKEVLSAEDLVIVLRSGLYLVESNHLMRAVPFKLI